MNKDNYLEIFEQYILHQTTAKEEEMLIEWIRTDPRLLAHMEKQIINMPSEIDSSTVQKNLEHIYAALDKKPVEKVRRVYHIPHWAKVAAVFLLPIVSALVVYITMQKNIVEKPHTPLTASVVKGQKAQLKLPDGSLVWLNANSSVTYSANYNKNERRVILIGEAYFEVETNPASPFIVDIDVMQIEAIGTSFVVKAYPEDEIVYTILKEGKILVQSSDYNGLLTPNERVQFDRKTNKYSKSNVISADDYIGWINDRIRFENSSFEQIMKDIERIYDVEIEVRNSNLLARRFTGSVPNNTVQGILNCIQYSVPFSYQKNDNKIIIE